MHCKVLTYKLFVVIVFVNYIVKCVQLNKGLKSVSLEQKTMTANHVFDTIDIDGNGTIEYLKHILFTFL